MLFEDKKYTNTVCDTVYIYLYLFSFLSSTINIHGISHKIQYLLAHANKNRTYWSWRRWV